MIAALPMYDHPALRGAHDALWAGLREDLRVELSAAGLPPPEALSRDLPDLWAGWEHPDLLLGQACSLPVRARLHPRVVVYGAFDYGLPDCPAGHYFSHFVTRATDARPLAQMGGARLAFNEAMSHSGWAAPQLYCAARGIPLSPHLETGAHIDSARAIAAGRADIAAIDAITWRALEAFEPDLTARLAIIGRTECSPGQALIGAAGPMAPHVETMRAALTRAAAAAPAALGIVGFAPLEAADYIALPTPRAPALQTA